MAAGHAGLQLSFGSTGDCFDNAAMETFWATLKREIAHIRGSSGTWFETRDAARGYLFESSRCSTIASATRPASGTSRQPNTPPGSANVHKPVSRIRGQHQSGS